MGTGKVGIGSLPHSARLAETRNCPCLTKDLLKHIRTSICETFFAVLDRAADYIDKVG
jgi:hypothetical protein